jgi:hypothetical protein
MIKKVIAVCWLVGVAVGGITFAVQGASTRTIGEFFAAVLITLATWWSMWVLIERG